MNHKIILASVMAGVVVAGTSIVFAASTTWTAPSSPFPDLGGISAPLDEGSSTQSRKGAIDFSQAPTYPLIFGANQGLQLGGQFNIAGGDIKITDIGKGIIFRTGAKLTDAGFSGDDFKIISPGRGLTANGNITTTGDLFARGVTASGGLRSIGGATFQSTVNATGNITTNGKFILGWGSSGILFADGSVQRTAAIVNPQPIRTANSNGRFSLTNVFWRQYQAGGGNHTGWWTVNLDPNRRLLGIEVSGFTDDGGACGVTIPGYFAGYSGQNIANWTTLPVTSASPGDVTAWNSGQGSIPDAQFVFESVPAGLTKQVNAPVGQGAIMGGGGNSANVVMSNKATGVMAIPPGRTMWVMAWYNDGGGVAGATCNINAIYE